MCVRVCVMTKLPSLFAAQDRSVLIRCEYNSSIGRWSLFLAHDNVTRRTAVLTAQWALVDQSLSRFLWHMTFGDGLDRWPLDTCLHCQCVMILTSTCVTILSFSRFSYYESISPKKLLLLIRYPQRRGRVVTAIILSSAVELSIGSISAAHQPVSLVESIGLWYSEWILTI